MSEQTLPVHKILARTLKDLGADTLFGLMGDSNLFMVDSYVRDHGGRYVAATHEANAVLMALGHAQMTGDVAFCTITQGPALSNAVTALVEGTKSSLPVVLLCGDTPAAMPDHPQTVQQRAMIEASGAGYARLRTPQTAAIDLRDAMRRAWVERRPIALNMPTEMMWEPAPVHPVSAPARPDPVAPSDGAEMDKAIGILAAARSPLILAGRGAVGARDALITLANRIGAPMGTTLKAKGLFSGEAHNIGVFGTLSTPAASDVIARSDCIVAFGAGLNRFTTMGGANLEGRRLIQIDDDPRFLNRVAPADAAIAGDHGLVAEAFVRWLDAAEIPSSRATDTIDAEALSTPMPMARETRTEGCIDFPRALARLDAALPADRIFASDAGRFLQEAWYRISVTHPRNMLLSIGVGAIGMGLGEAIGGAIARPDQTVLFVTGDGGFMMNGLSEFSSAIRENLDMILVVCNDNAYGAEYVQFEDRQMDPGLSQFNWPNLANVARAMGADGIQVRSETDLDSALDRISARTTDSGPLLIELMLDPAEVIRLQL